jgi:hypothetical protein
MAKKDITPDPDALARKTFLMTIIGALLYITVVFVFVISGNRRDPSQAHGEGEALKPGEAFRVDPAKVVTTPKVAPHD